VDYFVVNVSSQILESSCSARQRAFDTIVANFAKQEFEAKTKANPFKNRT
jgi:hypothetical protein